MKHLLFICFAVAVLTSCTTPVVEENQTVETPVVESTPVVVDTTAVEVPIASEEAPAVETPTAE